MVTVTQQFGDLTQTRKVVKKRDGSYTHEISEKYPQSNVEHMRKEWRKVIEQRSEFLSNVKEQKENAYKRYCEQLETEVDAARKELNEQLAKDKETLKEELYEQFLKEANSRLEEFKDLDKMKQQFSEKLEEEYTKAVSQAKQDKKEKEEALNLWTRVEVE